MLVKITTYNNTVYKFASKTTDTSDGIYLGRLRDDLSLTSMASASGTVPASQNLTIYNADNYISKSENFWGASLLLTQENGLTWLGKVTFFNFDSDGNLYLTASEKGAPELELQLPDEVRQVYTIDNNFHQSSTTMTIPLAIGGSTANPLLLPTILIDKTEGVYLICVGEIRSVLKVHKGTEELPSSAYQAYTGTASQSLHPGFAYVKINKDYRTNTDGSYAEINVELVGLKLGTHTEAECRNGARFLLWFLKTASSGINGWGCGIPESEIDVASFNSAISLVDLMGLKLDGIMWLRQSAQNWIDQICQAIHGSYSIGSNGKRKLTIDYAGAASKKTFNASKIILNKYGKDSYVSTVYNKGILSYGYNPITGLFMQSAQFENADSIAQIGEQKFVGESYLIQDASTALAILEYNCKKSLSSAEAINFTTDDLTTDLFAGEIITLDRSDIGITGEFQITSISTSDTKSEITAVRFDRSVFTVTGSHSNVNWGNEKNITPALTPAQATNLLLSTGFDINQDGTGNPYISGTFTVPEGGWLAAAVQYGIGANPTNYTELALITEGRFKIQPVNVGTVYTIRVRMITATGHSDYITGQITSTGDTVPPAIPTIVLNSTEKSVIVKCAIDNPPSDMGGFQIWRKKHTEEVFTLVGNVAANFGYASFPDHVETFVEYDYKAKSYDRSGNLSDFSQVVSITPTGLEATELAATAIKIPTGSILNINAKGSTTESIKTANGVIDGSGFGHHGQAFGGVSIVNDDELGQCFDFDGTNGRATVLGSLLNGCRSLTLSFRWKSSEPSSNNWVFCASVGGQAAGRQLSAAATADNFQASLYYNSANIGICRLDRNIFDNKVHLLTYTVDFNSATAILYFDGEKVAEANDVNVSSDYSITANNFNIGNAWAAYTAAPHKGKISDFRIYPRALSAVEVKSLNMIPQEAIMQRVTADLIGANAINSIHINSSAVTSDKIGAGEVKANNIDSNAVTTDKLSANAVTADKVGANAITAEKLNVEAVRVPAGCQLAINAKGIGKNLASGSTVPDESGFGQVISVVGGTLNWARESNHPNRVSSCFYNRGTTAFLQGPAINVGTGSFTLSMWLLSYDNGVSNYQCVCGSKSGAASVTQGFGIYVRNNKLLWSTANGSQAQEIFSANTYSLSTDFHHVVMTRDASNLANSGIYLDGVKIPLASNPSLLLNVGNLPVCFGHGGPNNSLVGNCAFTDGRFFTRLLSDAEIKTLYMLGTDTESGQITADRIATDAIKSRNYAYSSGDFSTAGTFLDLANGAITSKNFCIKSDGSAFFKGNVSADSGYIGNFTISGGALVANNTFGQGLNSIELKGGGVSSRGGATYDNVSRYDAFEIHNINYSTATAITDEYHSTIGPGTLSVRYYKSSSAYGYFDINANAVGDVYSTSILYIQQDTTTKFGLGVKGKAYCSSGAWSGSDKNTKSQIKQESVINRLKQIELTSWKYDQDKIDGKKTNKGTNGQPKHFGPMAQEFNAVFGTSDGASDSICYTDTIGVALRAIQELAQQVDDLKRQTRLYKRILNITNEQIAEERDKTAIRKLEIAKARQAKRELAILARNSEIENSVIEPILEVEKLANNSESSKNHDY